MDIIIKPASVQELFSLGFPVIGYATSDTLGGSQTGISIDTLPLSTQNIHYFRSNEPDNLDYLDLYFKNATGLASLFYTVSRLSRMNIHDIFKYIISLETDTTCVSMDYSIGKEWLVYYQGRKIAYLEFVIPQNTVPITLQRLAHYFDKFNLGWHQSKLDFIDALFEYLDCPDIKRLQVRSKIFSFTEAHDKSKGISVFEDFELAFLKAECDLGMSQDFVLSDHLTDPKNPRFQLKANTLTIAQSYGGAHDLHENNKIVGSSLSFKARLKQTYWVQVCMHRIDRYLLNKFIPSLHPLCHRIAEKFEDCADKAIMQEILEQDAMEFLHRTNESTLSLISRISFAISESKEELLKNK